MSRPNGRCSCSKANSSHGCTTEIAEGKGCHASTRNRLGTFLQQSDGNAQATKDGGTHKITGTATDMHKANKPFEIDVTC
jgi:hypothetical protein